PIEAARRDLRAHPDGLLAGEQGGLAPAGFDFGNSPVAFAAAALAGRRVVFATTNGTRAMHMAREASLVLLGCLRNRSAVAREALSAARDGVGLSLGCGGGGAACRWSGGEAESGLGAAVAAAPFGNLPGRFALRYIAAEESVLFLLRDVGEVTQRDRAGVQARPLQVPAQHGLDAEPGVLE